MKNQNRISLAANKEHTTFGIAIPSEYNESILIKDINKINFSYIKYVGVQMFKENEIDVQKHFIEFVGMPKAMIEVIIEIIGQNIELINSKKTIYESLSKIVNLFSKHKFSDKDQKQFNGDFGEALFIWFCKNKYQFDISKYYRSFDNLYDFYLEEIGKNIEIKSCHKSNGKIILNLRQIEESDKKDFYVSEFQFLEGKTTILDIYEEIGFDSKIIKEKYEYWKIFASQQEGSQIILKTKTVDLNKVNCFLISNNVIPKVTLTNDELVENIDITLNVRNCRDLGTKSLEKDINKIKNMTQK